MSGAIGLASDFYRLRIVRIDEGGDVEFDWRDDVLWRRESSKPAEECDVWVLQAVLLDEEEAVVPIAAFAAEDAAHDALGDATVDLETLTRSEFEAEYLHSTAEEPFDLTDVCDQLGDGAGIG